jgi:hypothetical protein
MKASTNVQLLKAVVNRAVFGDWAREVARADGEVLVVPCGLPDDGQVANWQVVQRGVWRMSGGQRTERPAGVTQAMSAQLARALSDMDAEMLTPATAAAVIQVGLYGEVRYPQP